MNIILLKYMDVTICCSLVQFRIHECATIFSCSLVGDLDFPSIFSCSLNGLCTQVKVASSGIGHCCLTSIRSMRRPREATPSIILQFRIASTVTDGKVVALGSITGEVDTIYRAAGQNVSLLIFNLNKNLHELYKKYFVRYSIFGNLLHDQRISLGLTKKYRHGSCNLFCS